MNISFNSNEEKLYYEMLVDALEDGQIDDSERRMLERSRIRYNISENRAKELENSLYQPHFNNKEEELYYEMLIDTLEDGQIDDSERRMLEKSRIRYNISENRAKELENFLHKTDFNDKEELNLESFSLLENNINENIDYSNSDNENISLDQDKIVEDLLSQFYETEGYYLDVKREINIIFKEFEYILKNFIYAYFSRYYDNESYNYYKNICFKYELFDLTDLLTEKLFYFEEYPQVIRLKRLSLFVKNCIDEDDELEIDYDIMEILLRSAKSQYELKNYQRALKEFYNIVYRHDYENSDVWQYIANSHNLESEFYEAIDAYEKAIEYDDEDDSIFYGYAVALENVERIDEAINALENVLNINPYHSYAKEDLNRLKNNYNTLSNIASNIDNVLDDVIDTGIDVAKSIFKDIKRFFK